MPTRRHYANTAAPTTLAGGISNADVTFNVTSAAGYPASFPYLAVIDRTTNATSSELVLVTAGTGNSVTVTRAQGGTSAVAHSSGASFEHCSAAVDFDEANAHTTATSAVHGLTGNVVGDTDAQTLTNKTLTSPTINGATIDTTSTIAGTVATAIVTLTASQTLTNKTLNGAALDLVSTINGVTAAALTNAYTNVSVPLLNAWTAFTPAFTNLTVGNGTAAGKYLKTGKRLQFRIQLTAGTTTSVSGPVSLTLPASAQTPNDGTQQNLDGRIGKTKFAPVDVAVAANATSGSLSFFTGSGSNGGSAHDNYEAVTATVPTTETGGTTTWLVSGATLVVYGELEIQ